MCGFPERPLALKFESGNRRTCCLSNAVENVQHRNFDDAFFVAAHAPRCREYHDDATLPREFAASGSQFIVRSNAC